MIDFALAKIALGLKREAVGRPPRITMAEAKRILATREKARRQRTLERARRNAKNDDRRYREKAAAERETVQRFGSPYERAVTRIEKLTGISRDKWEHNARHAYTAQAIRAARVLAGIESAGQRENAA